jgi:hypothetical protein
MNWGDYICSSSVYGNKILTKCPYYYYYYYS